MNKYQKWIAIEDALPPIETSIIVADQRGNVWGTWASDEDGVFWFYDEESDNRVTHWMPCPAHPLEQHENHGDKMTAKFGDNVLHKEYGTGVVVDESTCVDGISVIFHGDSRPCLVSKEEVTPIVHPDTFRLDWLINNLYYMDIEDIRAFLKACMCSENLQDVCFEKLLAEIKGE